MQHAKGDAVRRDIDHGLQIAVLRYGTASRVLKEECRVLRERRPAHKLVIFQLS